MAQTLLLVVADYMTRNMLNILIVDDHRSSAETLQLALQTKGHQVLIKQSVSGAMMLETEIKRSFDVILTDYDVRSDIGITLLNEFKGQNPNRKSILITGLDIGEINGADDFDIILTKPLEIEVIEQLIHHWNSNAKRFSESENIRESQSLK